VTDQTDAQAKMGLTWTIHPLPFYALMGRSFLTVGSKTLSFVAAEPPIWPDFWRKARAASRRLLLVPRAAHFV